VLLTLWRGGRKPLQSTLKLTIEDTENESRVVDLQRKNEQCSITDEMPFKCSRFNLN